MSEVIALAVEDVDLESGTVHVRRASVVGEFKVPKERSRLRTVELIDPALELMREILADASQATSVEIKVIQRDNITSKKQRIRFLFRSSTSGLLWNGKTLSNWFTSHLKKQRSGTVELISVDTRLRAKCYQAMYRLNGLHGNWDMQIQLLWCENTMEDGYLETPRAWQGLCRRCWGLDLILGVYKCASRYARMQNSIFYDAALS